ncbi:MAG: pilus assembly protein CpaF [Chloroflexi bacterium]|nr:MAG: pilus assembly protein CpaF [Chloroflexota bacterium]
MTESAPPADKEIGKLKSYLIGLILSELENKPVRFGDRRQIIIDCMLQTYQSLNLNLPPLLRDQLFKDVLDDILGFGLLQPLLDDPDISEIMVNGKDNIFIEQKGKLTKANISFENDEQILQIIDRIILPLGRRIDADSPTVDARLPDGSRVNAVIPPVAIDGPTITIRKFGKGRLHMDDLIEKESLTQNMASFIEACVVSKLNIIVSGGTGSGKTTLLNAISGYIPDGNRIITIEDAAELKLQQSHIVRMEAKPANVEGKNAVTIRDLVRNSLRMRPDRIVVGEVRGGECLDMLQAMNTGHDGSLTTLHANTPRDAISRMETLTLMAGMELPLRVVREQIASAVDLIIQLSRLKDGSRRVTYITEVSGMEGDTVVMTDIFKFEQTGIDASGIIIGELRPTGIRPLFTPRLEANGFRLGPEVFGVNFANMIRDQQHR